MEQRATNGKRTPTPKEKKFALKYLETGNASEAYRQSYNTKTNKNTSIHRMANETLSKPQVKNEIARLMDIQGITDDELIRIHKEGLNSTKFIDKDNEVPDYAVRHKYLETAYKVKGHTDNTDKAPIQVAFVINK